MAANIFPSGPMPPVWQDATKCGTFPLVHHRAEGRVSQNLVDLVNFIKMPRLGAAQTGTLLQYL